MEKRYYLLLITVVALAAAGLTPLAFAADPRERKNIDTMPDTEFQAYKHAVQMLQNSTGPNNYQHFADAHDVFSPNHGCEHQNELFFPWHRSLLYYFEQALRAGDPNGSSGPATKDVTIPYWDWTVPPSGARFPRRFEEAGSVLGHDGRNTAPLTAPMFPKAGIFQIIADTSSWPGFAGGPKSSPFFGAIEQPAHNSMHSTYVGGDMADPAFAAEDPIFWSFHAYIDLIWDRWQKLHKIEPTCSNCALRGLPPEKTPKDLVRVEQQLGYFYRENQGLEPVVLAAASVQATKPRVIDLVPAGAAAAVPTVYKGTKPHTFSLQIPKEPFRTARLMMLDVKIPTTISYSGVVYLHKPGQSLEDVRKDAENPPAGTISVWVGHPGSSNAAHGHPNRVAIYTDITKRLRELAKAHAGEEWAVTFIFEPIPVKSKRAPKAAPVEDEIQFHAIRLVLDGTYAESERDLKAATHQEKP